MRALKHGHEFQQTSRQADRCRETDADTEKARENRTDRHTDRLNGSGRS